MTYSGSGPDNVGGGVGERSKFKQKKERERKEKTHENQCTSLKMKNSVKLLEKSQQDI